MDIQFFRSNSLANVIDKSLTSVVSYPGSQLKDQSSDSNASFRVRIDGTALSPTKVNYFQFGDAFYFLESVNLIANGICEVHGRLDVLYTYRTAIQSLRVLGNRSTNQGSAAIADPMRRFSSKKNRTVLAFPNEISEDEADGLYVLVTSQQSYSAE